MTMNHVDRLDAVLLRPGRVGIKLELGQQQSLGERNLKERQQVILERPQFS
jgi:hypothetical protein